MKDGVRFAITEEERDACFALRYEVYADELHRQLPSMDHAARRDRSEVDDYCHLICAVEAGRVVGTSRIHWAKDAPFDEEEEFEYSPSLFADVATPEQMIVADRLVVARSHRKGPVPIQIFRFIGEFIVDHRIEICLCWCEPHLVSLYKRLGFRSYKGSIDYPGVGYVVPLIFVGSDDEYARQVGCPFMDLFTRRPLDRDLALRVNRLLSREGPVESAIDPDPERYLSRVHDLLTRASEGGFSLIDGLSDRDVAVLLERSNVLELRKGEQLIRRGTAGRSLFVVLEGVLEARDGARFLNAMTPGGVFGEIAFLLGQTRTADVHTVSEKARVLYLSESVLNALISSHSAAAARILLNLSRLLCLRLVTGSNAQ